MYRGYTKMSQKMFGYVILGFGLLTAGFMIYANVSSPQPEKALQPAPIRAVSTSTPAPLEEGKQYRRLPMAVSQNPKVLEFIAQDLGKVQVIEFFSYGCFGCQQLHAMINQWAKGKDSPQNQPPVVFYRFPLVFHTVWEPLAKIYYTLKTLGLSEKLDPEFFTAVNQNHIDFSKANILEDFVKMRGVDPNLFMETYRSFGVNRQLIDSGELSIAYQVTVSPYFVVNTPAGSFATSALMAGGNEGLLNVLNYLISLKSASEEKN
jgi:protein dithiol oxidoreductase (disulfide-forming)